MIYPKLSDGTIDWCVMCKHEGRAIYDGCCECEYTENSDDPPTKYEPKSMTNGDRIRRMTDEELAKAKILCPYTAVDMDMCEKWITSGDTRDCAACALDWLEQEAKDG
jgi:hypothetical protein